MNTVDKSEAYHRLSRQFKPINLVKLIADEMEPSECAFKDEAVALNHLLSHFQDRLARLDRALAAKENSISEKERDLLKQQLVVNMTTSFRTWWFSEQTTVAERVALLKLDELNPFYQFEKEEPEPKNFAEHRKLALSIMHKTLLDALWTYYPAFAKTVLPPGRFLTHHANLGNNLHNLLTLTTELTKGIRKPVDATLAQHQHLTYALMLTTLGFLETTQENANKLIDYATRCSGYPSNVTFNKRVGYSLIGIGATIAAGALVGTIVATFLMAPVVLSTVILPLCIVLGIAAVLIGSLYFLGKTKASGLSNHVDKVGHSTFFKAPNQVKSGDSDYQRLEDEPEKLKSLHNYAMEFHNSMKPLGVAG